MAENYNNLLCYAFQFPHYFVGELILVGLLAVSALAYRRLRPRGHFWWLDVLGFVAVAIALVDFRLSQIMGVRLGWDLLSFADSPTMMWRMARPYLPGLAVALAATALVYALALRGVQAWLDRSNADRRADRLGIG